MAVPDFTPEELESEEWRDVVGYEAFYEVSNLGRVRSKRFTGRSKIGQLLKPTGVYPHVVLCKGSRLTVKSFKVHLLVIRAFIGPCPESKEANHIDNNPGNARLSNLEYVTHKQNMEHSSRQGRMPGRPRSPGEGSPAAKLTSKDVVNIRRGILDGIPNWQLAEHYGVAPITISSVKMGRNWGHVTELRDEVIAIGAHKRNHRIHRRRARAKENTLRDIS